MSFGSARLGAVFARGFSHPAHYFKRRGVTIPLRKSPQSSLKLSAARRRNARKSTGPRTEAGKRRASRNSYRHGYYARPDAKVHAEMLTIGEDPDQLIRFERELTEAWQPSNAMQAMMVADLAQLYVTKAMMQKTVRAMRLEETASDQFAIDSYSMTTHCDAEPLDETRLEESGYRSMAESEMAQDESHRLLTQLTDCLERRDWNGDLQGICKLLYGRHPTGMGHSITKLFEWLAASTPQSEPGLVDTACRSLKLFVQSESDKVNLDKDVTQRRRREEFMYERGSDWLPGSANYNRVLAQDGRLDRQIDNKVKLLVRLQGRRPRKDAQSDDDDAFVNGKN